jgi:hypothetical protein
MGITIKYTREHSKATKHSDNIIKTRARSAQRACMGRWDPARTDAHLLRVSGFVNASGSRDRAELRPDRDVRGSAAERDGCTA